MTGLFKGTTQTKVDHSRAANVAQTTVLRLAQSESVANNHIRVLYVKVTAVGGNGNEKTSHEYHWQVDIACITPQ